MSRKGHLVSDGDTATITFRRVFHHSPEHVWDAVATPEGLCEWLMCTDARIDGRVEAQLDGTPLPDWTARLDRKHGKKRRT